MIIARTLNSNGFSGRVRFGVSLGLRDERDVAGRERGTSIMGTNSDGPRCAEACNGFTGLPEAVEEPECVQLLCDPYVAMADGPSIGALFHESGDVLKRNIKNPARQKLQR